MNPSFDPLYLHQPLEHRVEFPVLGIPVRFATNDPAILDQIEEVFGHWRGCEMGSAKPSAGADIRLFLHDGDEGSAEPPLHFRAPDPLRWMVHTPGSFGLADLERRVGVAYVTRALVEDRPRFRVSILQFLVFIIITIEDRTPIHAAMIGRDDAALLLAGPAGSGKSTLAYAASKAGLDLLSDDAAYIQLEPRRVWGGGPSVMLLADAAARWSELAGKETALFPTGKRKMTVRAANESARPFVTRARVCLLDRSNGPVKVARIGAEQIRPIIMHDPAGAGGRFGARLEQGAEWLSAQGGWRLSLSREPSEAVPYLQELLQEVEAVRGADSDA